MLHVNNIFAKIVARCLNDTWVFITNFPTTHIEKKGLNRWLTVQSSMNSNYHYVTWIFLKIELCLQKIVWLSPGLLLLLFSEAFSNTMNNSLKFHK